MHIPKQEGMTAIGWLIVLGLVAFFAVIAIRLMPVYLESFKVGGALESLKMEPFITQKSKGEILSMLSKRFDIEDVRTVDPKKHISVEKQRGVMKIVIDYERREHIMGNLDILAHFRKDLELVEN